MSTFSVVVATYGDLDTWGPLAGRALRSVARQTHPPVSVERVHGATLAEARNTGGRAGAGEWLVFLDADDELDHGYLAAMNTAANAAGDASVLLKPATLGVYPDGTTDAEPVMIPPRPLLESNHLVIGTGMRRAAFEAAGGFIELPALEDWHLFIRMQLAKATVVEVPDAIYRVGVWPGSRNQDTGAHGQTYVRIRDEFAWAR